jgi:hypothetical protein
MTKYVLTKAKVVVAGVDLPNRQPVRLRDQAA